MNPLFSVQSSLDTVHAELLILTCWQRTVYNVNCTVYNVNYTVYTVNCTVYNVNCTVYNVNCTVYTVNCTVYNVNCTVYNVNWTVYTVNCTVYILHFSGASTPILCQGNWAGWGKSQETDKIVNKIIFYTDELISKSYILNYHKYV